MVVQAGIDEHGGEREQKALANFTADPETYEGALVKVMTQLAERSPAFLAQLQALSQQASIQPGVQGSVNVSGHGRIYGVAGGVITGDVTGSPISINEDDDDERPARTRKPPQGWGAA